jgi:hypothetical protein
MDLVRNIISNLYIYTNQADDKLNLSNFGIKPLSNKHINELISKTENNEQSISFKNNIEEINSNNVLRKNNSLNSLNRLDNYNQKYIILKNNNFLKNEVNYVLKNKELIQEQEKQMKEMNQNKEHEALNLLLSYKSRKTDSVNSRIYDYAIKQQKEKEKKIFKIRNLSSQKLIRNKNKINNNNNENKYQNLNQNKGDINTINQDENKIKINFAQSLKLPQIKPTTSPSLDGTPMLREDRGKTPECSEKRKKEMNEQKILEILKEKEKKIPNGWKILSEEERQKRLSDLNTQKRELEEKLYKLPIARLSRQQEELKKNIEKSLDEIDQKINKLTGYKEVIVKEAE